MTDPLAEQLSGCWTGVPSDLEATRRLLRLVGAPDLAEQDALTTSAARHLPALRAGHIAL
jgi:fructuronate reductase